jgi:glycosyltransferase involved in cell wall biosynthesis
MKVSIYVVQYNKPEFMELQYRLINKYCKDEFEYIIVNNADNDDNVERFHEFCVNNNVREIQTFQDRIPNTQDHSRALKYVYDEYLSKDESDFRVVMDHDMFPFGNFSIADVMGDFEVGGIKLGHHPFFISSFIIIFNKNVDLINTPIDIVAKQDATVWTYGIANKYKVKWLNHTTQGYREMYYIFRNIHSIIEEYNRHNDRNITFQIVEPNLLHYWQGSEWYNHDKDFHERKLEFIKFVINNMDIDKLMLDINLYYERAIMDMWIKPDDYPLNKIDENEYI